MLCGGLRGFASIEWSNHQAVLLPREDDHVFIAVDARARRAYTAASSRWSYPQSPRELVRVAPFVVACLLTSTLLSLLTTKPEYGYESSLVFHVPDIADVRRTFTSLVSAPLLNRGPQQVLYVGILLLTFGVLVERREGTTRTMLLFFGCSTVGAFVAASVLYATYPYFNESEFFVQAWHSAWSGGSAGALGLAGAYAARHQRAWLIFGLLLLWEANVAIFRLQNYTPAFHLGAMFTGFFMTRYLLAERDSEHRAARSPARA
jgi:membrane associated rhomboid family serine protease